jgi:uncharacterized OB-fold protein
MNIVARAFPAGSEPEDLLPELTVDNAAFWDGLAAGKLVVQHCNACQRHRFPIAPVCPHCGAVEFDWREIGSRGVVHSWIRYTKSYLAEFADVMPYVVACVAFPEGIRMFGRLVDAGEADPVIDAAVQGEVESWPGGRCVIHFKAA